VASERNRTQSANVEDCFAKLHEMIVAASATPREPTAETRERVKALYGPALGAFCVCCRR